MKSNEIEKLLDEIKRGGLNLLKFIENSREQLTSRDAEVRTAAINQLCSLLLKLEEDGKTGIDEADCDVLLDFLLSKVEDSGHLAEHLIGAIHHLIIHHFNSQKRLQNDQIEQVIASLFEQNSVQNYGKRDRRLLFAIFAHLLDSHLPELITTFQRKILTAFLRSAQGEREPTILLPIFKIHQRLAGNMKLGIFTEEMFELVACYFPVDYEPNECDPDSLQISREMLRSALDCCLLANDAFGPFCFQLVAEKLVDTDSEMDGDAGLINKQLETCEFLTAACKRFDKAHKDLDAYLDDYMTGFRLIFMNPAQNQILLEKSSKTIGNTLKALVHALCKTGDEVGKVKVQRLLNHMADSTLENIEPFILQAEMGTMGKAFRLLQCVALSHQLCRAKTLPRALYWLNLLCSGKTLRSAQNREEIALEALELMPGWVRICIGRDFGEEEKLEPSVSAIILEENGKEDMRKTAEEILSNSLLPLLTVLFSLDFITDKQKLMEAQCRELLLPICTKSTMDFPTVRIYADLLLRNSQFHNFCGQLWHGVFESRAKNPSRACNQFLTLFSHSTGPFPATVANLLNSNNSNTLNLLPALVYPKRDELGGRELARMEEEILQNSKCALIQSMTIAFGSSTMEEAVTNIHTACVVVKELAERIVPARMFVDEFFGQLLKGADKCIGILLEAVREKHFTAVPSLTDPLAQLFQHIGAFCSSSAHRLDVDFLFKFCWAIQKCSTGTGGNIDDGFIQCRIFWLLMLQNKNIDDLWRFTDALVNSILNNDTKLKEQPEMGEFFKRALLAFHFALFNRGAHENGQKWEELRERVGKAYSSISGESHVLVNFRLSTNEARSRLLTNPTSKHLEEIFATFSTLENADQCVLEDLLDFNFPSTDPERNLFNRTPFWRQRIFCTIVPMLKKLAESGGERRETIFKLLGPLLRLIAPLPVDSLVNELAQLAPIIVEALPLALSPQQQNGHQSLAHCVLDGIHLLLEKQQNNNNFTEDSLRSIVLCLGEALLQQHFSMSIQLQILNCLELIPRRSSNRKDCLAPAYNRIVRSCTEMASSRKRLIRQRAAAVRNAWELALN